MKKILSILSIVLVTMSLFIACNNSTPSSPSVVKDSAIKDSTATGSTGKDSTRASSQKALLAATEIYTCSMHNEVIGDKPGHCSVCGMELVKQKPTEQQKKLIKEGTYKNPKS
jgi:heavy metal-binding protein